MMKKEENIKEIEIDGEKYLYEVLCNPWRDKGKEFYTYFYDTEPETVEVRKYILFGKKIKKKRYKWLFTVEIDITSPYYTKDKVREYIKYRIDILKREKEIKKGQII